MIKIANFDILFSSGIIYGRYSERKKGIIFNNKKIN